MSLKKKQTIAMTVLCLVLTIFVYYNSEYRKTSLKCSIYNLGIVDDFWFGSRSGYNARIVHEVNSQRIKSKVFRAKKCRNLKAGDTILVFYSLSDPSIVDISQCFWKPEFMDSIGLKSNQIVKNDWLE
jgi:hypothetical protein